MEPLVLFGAALVVYCGWLTVTDDMRAWRRNALKLPAKKRARVKKEVTATLFSTRGRGGGAAVRWPAPARGSA